jgi:chromate reductase
MAMEILNKIQVFQLGPKNLMVAVITGTNRNESTTSLVAAYCAQWLERKGYNVGEIRLTQLNGLTVSHDQFLPSGMDEVVKQMRDEILLPSSHWVLVIPEYNGSYPGILKWWIDLLSVYERNQVFQGKKISLIGVASGRAGNLRGLDDLTGVLHYLGMLVMPEKLPVSRIETLMNTQGQIGNELDKTLDTFLEKTFRYALQWN